MRLCSKRALIKFEPLTVTAPVFLILPFLPLLFQYIHLCFRFVRFKSFGVYPQTPIGGGILQLLLWRRMERCRGRKAGS